MARHLRRATYFTSPYASLPRLAGLDADRLNSSPAARAAPAEDVETIERMLEAKTDVRVEDERGEMALHKLARSQAGFRTNTAGSTYRHGHDQRCVNRLSCTAGSADLRTRGCA